MNPYLRWTLIGVFLPLIAAMLIIAAAFALILLIVDLVTAAFTNRPPDWFVFCTCPEIGGPAGDHRHHHRTCLIARAGRKLGRATEDTQTGWVTVR